jgi:hypothetical protein
MNQDQEHLNLLSIFHYIVGGIAVLFSLFPIIYLVLGVLFLTIPHRFAGSGPPPPFFLGWIFIFIGAGFMLVGLAFAVCLILAGRYVVRHKHYIFCLVMASLNCLFFPFGTILGVFTIVLLMRPSVKTLFYPAEDLVLSV